MKSGLLLVIFISTFLYGNSAKNIQLQFFCQKSLLNDSSKKVKMTQGENQAYTIGYLYAINYVDGYLSALKYYELKLPSHVQNKSLDSNVLGICNYIENNSDDVFAKDTTYDVKFKVGTATFMDKQYEKIMQNYKR